MHFNSHAFLFHFAQKKFPADYFLHFGYLAPVFSRKSPYNLAFGSLELFPVEEPPPTGGQDGCFAVVLHSPRAGCFLTMDWTRDGAELEASTAEHFADATRFLFVPVEEEEAEQ
jgi:hypothetical protein